MGKKKTVETSRDFRIAYRAAESFRGLAEPFLIRIGTDPKNCQHRAIRDVGGLISSATSIAFSIELFLKSLRTLIGMHIPQRHGLWLLYKDLPMQHKEAISAAYDANNEVANPTGGKIFGLFIQMSVGPFKEDQKARVGEIGPQPHEYTLKQLLKRNDDAFQTWRYLYELGSPERITVLRYDFYHLGLVADVLKEHIQKNDPQNQKYVH